MLGRLFGRGPHIRVHVVLKGRIGEGWYDHDEHLRVPEGTTLAGIVELAQRRGLPLRDAINNSPHLRDTLMLNGERCPIETEGNRTLNEGDQLYLLAPIAGG